MHLSHGCVWMWSFAPWFAHAVSQSQKGKGQRQYKDASLFTMRVHIWNKSHLPDSSGASPHACRLYRSNWELRARWDCPFPVPIILLTSHQAEPPANGTRRIGYENRSETFVKGKQTTGRGREGREREGQGKGADRQTERQTSPPEEKAGSEKQKKKLIFHGHPHVVCIADPPKPGKRATGA